MIRDVSSSELDALRQCPHKHALAFRDRWAPPRMSPALEKGSLMHSVLETHYKALKDGAGLDDAYKKIVPLLHDKEGNQSETQQLVTWMYEGYLDYYGIDKEWEIVAVEHEAQVMLPEGWSGRKSQFRLNMKIDLVVRWRGRLWLVDHKTGQNLPTDKELALADQFGLYCWGMNELDRRVHGVIYNALRTQRNKTVKQPMEERFARPLLYRTDTELKRIAVEAYQDFKAAYALKSEEAPRHPNQDTCRWRCPFTEPCLAARKMKPDMGVFEHNMLRSMGYVQDFSSDRGSLTVKYQEPE